MPAEHGQTPLLGGAGEEEPAAVPAGEVDCRVAPGLGRFRRARVAGFEVGLPQRWQAEAGDALAAVLEHAVQRGQVLAGLDGVARAAQNLLDRQLRQRVQPQLLDLIELLGIRVGGVILVVVIEPEQGEDLVDRLDAGVAVARSALTRPRTCR